MSDNISIREVNNIMQAINSHQIIDLGGGSQGTQMMLFNGKMGESIAVQQTMLCNALRNVGLMATAERISHEEAAHAELMPSSALDDVSLEETAESTSSEEDAHAARRDHCISIPRMANITELEILEVAQAIGSNEITDLGIELGIQQAQIQMYELTNHSGGMVSSQGTQQMLFDWKRSVSTAEQRTRLFSALENVGLNAFAEEHLP